MMKKQVVFDVVAFIVIISLLMIIMLPKFLKAQSRSKIEPARVAIESLNQQLFKNSEYLKEIHEKGSGTLEIFPLQNKEIRVITTFADYDNLRFERPDLNYPPANGNPYVYVSMAYYTGEKDLPLFYSIFVPVVDRDDLKHIPYVNPKLNDEGYFVANDFHFMQEVFEPSNGLNGSGKFLYRSGVYKENQNEIHSNQSKNFN